MEPKKIKQLLIASVCVVGVYFLFQHAGDVLGVLRRLLVILAPFIGGAGLAFVLNVPMRFMEARVFAFKSGKPFVQKLRRPLSLLVVVALALAIVCLLMALVIPQLKATITSVVRAVPGFIERADQWLSQYGIHLAEYLGGAFKLPTGEEMSGEVTRALDLLLKGVAFSGSVIGTVYDNVLSVFFTIMFTFYFLFAKERLLRQTRRVMEAFLKPAARKKLCYVGSLTQRTFSSFLSGQCLEALILGGLFFVFMSVFRFPYVLLISLFISVMALIPVIGAWIACTTGALLILMVDPLTAVWFVVLFLILQQIEGNLIYPHVMGNAIGLPSLWVLFAVVLGEGLMGILGMILFIPLTSVCYALAREEVARRIEKKENGGAA